MIRYICTSPQSCGVSYHRKPGLCKNDTSPPRSPAATPELERAKAMRLSMGEHDYAYVHLDPYIECHWSSQSKWSDSATITSSYTDTGVPTEVYWSNDNGLHREDGPAYITYNSSGEFASAEYHRNGELHREDGPAELWTCSNSDGVVHSAFHLEGEQINRLGFQEYREVRDSGLTHEMAMAWISGMVGSDNASEREVELDLPGVEDPVTLEKGVLDDDARYVLSRGHCHSLALALNKRYGYEMIAVGEYIPDSDNDDQRRSDLVEHPPLHITAVDDDGMLVDVNGARDEMDVLDQFDPDESVGASVYPITEQDIEVLVSSNIYSKPHVEFAESVIPYLPT